MRAAENGRVRRAVTATVAGLVCAATLMVVDGTVGAMPHDSLACDADQLVVTLVPGEPGAGQRSAQLARSGQQRYQLIIHRSQCAVTTQMHVLVREQSSEGCAVTRHAPVRLTRGAHVRVGGEGAIHARRGRLCSTP